jgi:phosphohistidine phosphatase
VLHRVRIGPDCATMERMQRHLLLVRHVKSAWDNRSLADRDRPLAPRGVNALPLLSDHLVDAGHEPDVVLCSTARRTVDTLAGIRDALPDEAQVRMEADVYLAGPNTILSMLRDLDGHVGCAMVIGHNPGIQDLAIRLVGEGDAELRHQLATKVPTGAVVTLSFDGEWADLANGVASIDELFMPRKPRD